MINDQNPDFIAGTESWLSPNIYSSEIFPPTFTTFRRDRNDSHGGVFIACKSTFICEEITLSTSIENVACRIHLKNHSVILILAYRPPNTNHEYLEELCSTLSSIILSDPNEVIWLAGDLNLPNIDWNLYCTNGHNYHLQLCEKFIDTLLDHSLSQLVDSPTRKDNILDIFATNRPSLVTKCAVIPGISDHEAVLIVSDIAAKIKPPGTRKIFLWRKANFDYIKAKIQQFSDSLLVNYRSDQPVSILWNNFKSLRDDCLNLIPTKSISTNNSHPWISTFIRRLSRRKQQCYNRARLSCHPEDWQLYYQLKKECQKEYQRAYNNYINSFLDSGNGQVTKRL